MDAHNALVAAIATRVKDFHSRQQPFRLYHGSTNSTRVSSRTADTTVDTSDLNHILSVNTTTKTAVVEPNVPMDALVRATMEKGLVPRVVMEFPGITVGGGFSGSSGESSSFRYGGFEATCNEIEIVIPDGTIMKASRKENPDLFWGAASAFGTLGVVTLLQLQLQDAKKFVQLEYRLSRSAEETVQLIRQEWEKKENDYIDAIAFSKDAAAVLIGKLVDECPDGSSPQRFTRRHDQWFYVHVEKITKALVKGYSKPSHMDYIPLQDYLFRYDRGGFWAARYAFQYFITPFNRITRTILNPVLHTRVMFRALHNSDLSDYYMIQDVGVPVAAAADFQAWLDTNFNIYPLWLCPLHMKRDDPDSAHGLHSEFAKPDSPRLLNFGIWGPLSGDRLAVIRQNRALEQKVKELGGKKWLYAHAYYTEEEFWACYDRKSYDALRKKYGAQYLLSVYDKVKVDIAPEGVEGKTVRTNWPVAGLKGAYKAVLGGDYMLRKHKSEP